MTAPKNKLLTLDTALNKDSMTPVFQSLALDHFSMPVVVRDLQSEILRRRNQRCVIRYSMEIFNQDTLRNFRWNVIGKVYKADRGESVYRTMQAIWDRGFSHEAADGIRVPRAYHFSSQLCMLFQEEVQGESFKSIIKNAPKPEYMRRLARAIAKFHSTSLDLGPPMELRDHLLRCHPRYPLLALALPDLEPKINFIVEKADSILNSFSNIAPGPIHGDFHLGQIHMNDETISIIDFDASACGDPAADLGNLSVFLKGKAKHNSEMVELRRVFFKEYFSVMSPEIEHRIPLYEALTHLRRACKLLREQERGWPSKISRMLDEAIACLLGLEKAKG